MTRALFLAAACAASSACLAAGWTGSFANGLAGWKTQNHNNIATLSVEKFKGEQAFVVRHSGTNATSGTAWELRGARFAVTPGERLTVVVRACGSVEGMIAPHGYKGKFKTAIRWYGKDGGPVKDESGYGLESDTGFGFSVSASRWQYSFASIDVPSKAAFAEASLGADRPDFGRDDFLAVSTFKVVPAATPGGSGAKSALRDDGVLLVNGEPFFPIGVYSVRKCKFNGFSLEKAFADLKDAGFNTVLNSTDFSVLEEFLALADRTGMKTFALPAGNSFDADIYAKGFLQSHRGHPSVIAWYVADDTASYASPGEVADRHRVCHALDPDRLTLQADGALMEGINRYAPYVHFTDVFLPEIYPYGFSPEPKGDEIAKFVNQMRAVGAALKENGSPVKGIWPIVQFFRGWSSWQYFPDERELRAQCFAALAHRARGLMLYLYGSRNEQKNEGAVSTPERWAATRRVFREVASIQSDLLSRDAAEQPAATVLEGPASDALGQSSVSLLLKTGESPLLIAVNSANERVRVRFGVKGFAGAAEIFERRAISVGEGGFEDEFDPIGVHVYRLSAAPSPAADEIVCEGAYTGHLQGVDTDGTNIWWSFTSTLVRTDLKGRVLARTEAPRHQGDLCVRGGRLYVAVNRGRFNQLDEGVSEVTAYDAQSLAVIKTWPLDLPFGAGGMTEMGGRFYVVGGLPATVESNWVAEYDGDFNLVKMHQLKTGFTLMGVQTASAMDGKLYFGIYGDVGDPSGVLECPGDLSSFVRYTGDGSMGILRIGRTVYTAQHAECGEWGMNETTGRTRRLRRAKLVADADFCTAKNRYEPVRTGRGLVQVFFEGEGTNGWHDAGYTLRPNGYEPLFRPGKLNVFAQVDEFCFRADAPAVGIGGGRSYGAADLVRAVRRCAEKDEAFAIHVPGLSSDIGKDAKLAAALAAVVDECARLGVRCELGTDGDVSSLVVRRDYDVAKWWRPKTFMGKDFWPLFKPGFWTVDSPEWKADGAKLGKTWPPLDLYREAALIHDGVLSYVNDVVRDRGGTNYLKRGAADYKSPVKLGDFFPNPARTTLYANPKPDSPVFVEIQNARPAFCHLGNYEMDMADFAKWKAAHPNFVAFRTMAEFDSDSLFYELSVGKIADPSLREAMIAAYGLCDTPAARLAAMREAVRRTLPFRFGEVGFWGMFSSSFSMGHQFADLGATGLFYEATSQSCGRWQVAGAFLRGAARQFDIPYGWYVATWCTGATRDGKIECGANSLASMQDKTHRPLMGAGRNSADRQSAYGWLIGSSFMEVEGPQRTHLEQKDGKPPTTPSGYARDMDALYRLSKTIDRGAVYAPCAILTPLELRYTSSGSPWFGGHPYAFNAFFYTLAPVLSDLSQLDLRRAGNQSRLYNSRFGEFYDVLVPDSDQPAEKFLSALSAYKVAFLLGEYDAKRLDKSSLAAYVRGGGTLVVSSDKVASGLVPADLAGVKFGERTVPSKGYGEEYAWRLPEGTPAARPLERDDVGTVVLWAHDVGRGRVVTAAADHFLPAEYATIPEKSKYRVSGEMCKGERSFTLVSRLLDRAQRETMPVAVEGDVQWGVNRAADGWRVWLINNKGVTKYTFEDESFDASRTADVTVRFKDSGRTVYTSVGPGEWRIVQ